MGKRVVQSQWRPMESSPLGSLSKLGSAGWQWPDSWLQLRKLGRPFAHIALGSLKSLPSFGNDPAILDSWSPMAELSHVLGLLGPGGTGIWRKTHQPLPGSTPWCVAAIPEGSFSDAAHWNSQQRRGQSIHHIAPSNLADKTKKGEETALPALGRIGLDGDPISMRLRLRERGRWFLLEAPSYGIRHPESRRLAWACRPFRCAGPFPYH